MVDGRNLFQRLNVLFVFSIVNETYIFFYEIHVVGFKILGNIFAPPPPGCCLLCGKSKKGVGNTPPELIPEYASASNAIIFYKQSTVKKICTYNTEETWSDIRLAWQVKIYANISII